MKTHLASSPRKTQIENMQTYHLSDYAVRLLYGLLREHQKSLLQDGYFDSVRGEELDRTDNLLYVFGEALDEIEERATK